jgi:type VI protein secretion system component VasK
MTTTDQDDDDASKTSGVSAPVTVIVVVAIAVLIIYIVFIILNWNEVDTDNDATWVRRIMLLGGIEAIAFAAAGWLFGREVGRESAAKAEAAKDKAETAKDKAQGDANAAKADALRLSSRVTQAAAGGGFAMSASSGDTELASLAREIEERWSP